MSRVVRTDHEFNTADGKYKVNLIQSPHTMGAFYTDAQLVQRIQGSNQIEIMNLAIDPLSSNHDERRMDATVVGRVALSTKGARSLAALLIEAADKIDTTRQ